MKQTMRYLLAALALVAGFATASAYDNGVHFGDGDGQSFPLEFNPAHEFDDPNWNKKVVLHPGIFPTFDTAKYSYTLVIEGSGNFQVGRAPWTSDGHEQWNDEKSEIGYFDAPVNLDLTGSISYINDGWCMQINAGSGYINKISLEIKEKENPGEVQYENGVHLLSPSDLPMTSQHNFTSDWSNKLVLHPEVFAALDTENYTYTLRVQTNTSVQVGTALWGSDGRESDFAELSSQSGNFDLVLTPTLLKRIQGGRCLQFNNGEGAIYSIELIAEAGGYVEPDYSKGGFHTDGTRLLDANDNEFVMRGINYSWAWQKDLNWQIGSTGDWGFNCIRIQISTGTQWGRTEYNDLVDLIDRCEKAKIVGIFNIQDFTGSDSRDDLRSAANFWCQSDIVELLNQHRATVIVNICNEWPTKWCAKDNRGAVADDAVAETLWRDGYCEVIPMLREAGLHTCLMVDCGGYGQDYMCVPRYGREVYESDPDHNIVFSMHMYQVAGDERIVVQNMSNALSVGCPLVFGEMAFEHKVGEFPHAGPVAWKDILEYSYRHKLGWLGWSWSGNGDDAQSCDMFGGNDWQPLENGKCLFYGPWGVKMTSTRCTIYDSNPGTGLPYQFPDPESYADETFSPFPYLGESEADRYDKDTDRGAAEEGSHFSRTFPYEMEKWHNSDIYVAPEFFNLIGVGSSLKIELSDVKDGAAIEFYHPTEVGSEHWTRVYEDFSPASDGTYSLPLYHAIEKASRRAADAAEDSRTLGDRLGEYGLHIKGRQLTVQSITLDHGDLTGVASVAVEASEAPAEYFTLTGQRVAAPAAGQLYIVRRGTEVSKTIF